jgi:DNA-directed RNA polymerase specialized sigma24 family protein
MSMLEKAWEGALRHIECELEHYRETRDEILQLKKEIDAEWPDGFGKSTLLAKHRRHEAAVRIVVAIDLVMNKLPEEKRELIRLKYWSGFEWHDVVHRLQCGPRKARRWHDEVIREIAEELGWTAPKAVS